MVVERSCKIECKNCGYKFQGQHLSGGFVYHEWLKPECCPKCHSKKIKEVTLLGEILNLLFK